MMRQLMGYPSLYYTKSFYPLELLKELLITCGEFVKIELWCKEIEIKIKFS